MGQPIHALAVRRWRKSYWVKDEAMSSLQPLTDGLPESQETNELADLIRRASRLPRSPEAER